MQTTPLVSLDGPTSSPSQVRLQTGDLVKAKEAREQGYKVRASPRLRREGGSPARFRTPLSTASTGPPPPRRRCGSRPATWTRRRRRRRRAAGCVPCRIEMRERGARERLTAPVGQLRPTSSRPRCISGQATWTRRRRRRRRAAGCVPCPTEDAREGRPRAFDRPCWPTPARFLHVAGGIQDRRPGRGEGGEEGGALCACLAQLLGSTRVALTMGTCCKGACAHQRPRRGGGGGFSPLPGTPSRHPAAQPAPSRRTLPAGCARDDFSA